MDSCIGSRATTATGWQQTLHLAPNPLQLEGNTNHHHFQNLGLEYDQGLDQVSCKVTSECQHLLTRIPRYENAFGNRIAAAGDVLRKHVVTYPFATIEGQFAFFLPETVSNVPVSRQDGQTAVTWTWRVGKVVRIALVLPKANPADKKHRQPVLRFYVCLPRLHLLLAGNGRAQEDHGNCLLLPDIGGQVERRISDLRLLHRVVEYFRMVIGDMLRALGVLSFDLVESKSGRLKYFIEPVSFETFSDFRKANGGDLTLKQRDRLRRVMLAANDGEPLKPLEEHRGMQTRRRSRTYLKTYPRGYGVWRVEAVAELPPRNERCRRHYSFPDQIESCQEATNDIIREVVEPRIEEDVHPTTATKIRQARRRAGSGTILFQRDLTPALIRDGLEAGLLRRMPGGRAGFRLHHRLVRRKYCHADLGPDNSANQAKVGAPRLR